VGLSHTYLFFFMQHAPITHAPMGQQFIITVFIGSGSSFRYLVWSAQGLVPASLFSKPELFTCRQAALAQVHNLSEQGWQASLEVIDTIQAEGFPSLLAG
jgi:hypothetical protein